MNVSSLPILCVGAVVFKDESVLLIKRKNPPNKGQWTIPGGKVQFSETLQQAAKREIFEETGINIRAGSPVYQFEVIQPPEYHYYIVDLEADYLSGEPVAQDDASEAGWFDRAALRQNDINQSTRELLKDVYQFY